MITTSNKQVEVSGLFEVALTNVGNPDYGQDPARKLPGTKNMTAKVKTLREAADVCRDYILSFDLGGGNWTGGQIVRISDGLVVGRVSYSGRVWGTDGKEIAL